MDINLMFLILAIVSLCVAMATLITVLLLRRKNDSQITAAEQASEASPLLSDATITVRRADFITRNEIAEYIRNLENQDLAVVEKIDNPQFPYSLKWKIKTFALLYAVDNGVLMVVRVPVDYVEILKRKYNVKPSTFPKGRNWFAITVDNRFETKQEVFDILNNAAEYIKSAC